MRIEKLKENFDVEVTLIHFPLHPETPVQGQSLEDLFAGRDMDINAMYLRMKGLMDAEGLEYGPQRLPALRHRACMMVTGNILHAVLSAEAPL